MYSHVDTNNTLLLSLSLLGKSCSGLRCLHLAYCPGVDDEGLIAVAAKIRLTHITISHNHNITDKGIQELISNSRQLISLSIVDCANISDGCLNGVGNPAKSPTRTRKSNFTSLTAFVFRDNGNATSKLLGDVSRNAPLLRTLDVRGCSNINFTAGTDCM